ncbi:hypothetical protein DB35_14415 [Streptomyces abyssalis]|uniref:Lipoprotein n=1 Tax=Streptomyces abyssalis TaxID=933944 RepID=A0A1E7JGC0_9ACTN|nr:hypothetical protein [Streptomyces abyssalis]OEU85502.1 hypothetical protein AN215_23590 [Streptomyces abyssalis]OEU93035.1 hypothetical protein DB35_14415 [Streptomyces abyssalis]
MVLKGAVCVGLTVALAACGAGDPDAGTNGVGKLSASKIEKKARAAAEQADSVKLSGTVVSKGQTYRLDMRLQRDGAMGKVATKGGSTFWLLRMGKHLYLKADAGFWARQEKGGKQPSRSDVQAAGKLDGKYVKVPPEDPAYKQLSGFADMRVLLEGLLVMNGKRETGERSEVGGVKTVRVQGGSGSVVDVSLLGTPYPLRIQRAGGAGTLELDDWNKEFELEAPAKQQVVDYGKKIVANKG